jgi:hypothetical protein
MGLQAWVGRGSLGPPRRARLGGASGALPGASANGQLDYRRDGPDFAADEP